MPIPMPADQVLERYFLEMRCKVLDVGAALDRVEHADDTGQTVNDPRLTQLEKAVAVLTDGQPDRAARIQMIFSDPYDANWDKPRRH